MKSKSTVYSVDDLVFAKVRGYPSWPAKVTSVLEGSKPPKYSVFFFGTYEVANIKGDDLTPYNEQTHQSMEKLNGKRKSYPEALHEIKNKPNMTPTAPPPSVSSKSSTPRSQTPAKSAESTPQSKKRKDPGTPSSTASAKRSKLAPESQDSPSSEEVLSRSGRKIKVKRFADDHETPTVVSAGKSTGSSVSSPASAKSRLSNKSTSQSRAGSARRSVAADKIGLDGEPEEPIVGDLPKEKARTNIQAECDELVDNEEERKMIRMVEESAEINQEESGGKKLRVRAKCGVLLEVDISDPSRPKTFKSERARIMWDTATSINTRRMLSSLSQGEYLPTHLHDQILARADLTDAQRTSVKLLAHRQRVVSQKMWHLLEVRLIDIDFRIKSNLLMDHQNHDGCLLALRDLLEITLAPLMLKKYPEIVDTVRKCRRYIHSAEIRELADECYNKLKSLFVVPAGKTFRVYFDETVSQFRLYTENFTDSQLALLCRDPLFARPGQTEVDSEDELLEKDAVEDNTSSAEPAAAATDDDAGEERNDDKNITDKDVSDYAVVKSEAKQDTEEPAMEDGGDSAEITEKSPDEVVSEDKEDEQAEADVEEANVEKDAAATNENEGNSAMDVDDAADESENTEKSPGDADAEVADVEKTEENTAKEKPHAEKTDESVEKEESRVSETAKDTETEPVSGEKSDESTEKEESRVSKTAKDTETESVSGEKSDESTDKEESHNEK